MILTLVSIVGLVLCFVLFKMTDNEGWGLGAFVFGILSLVVILSLIINPVVVNGDLVGFRAVQQTVSVARQNDAAMSAYELAALQQKIVDQNQWLAKQQYWARHPLTNWFYPKGILVLGPIQ